MALKKNVFTPALVDLLDALTDLSFEARLHKLVVKTAIAADSKRQLPETGLKAKNNKTGIVMISQSEV